MMGGYGNMMGGWGYGPNGFVSGSWWGLIGMLLEGLFWVGLVVLAVYLFRRWTAGAPIKTGTTALNILNERFARGEITAEEFKRMKQEIGG